MRNFRIWLKDKRVVYHRTIIFVFFRLPELLILLVFLYFAYYVLGKLERDTLILTNSVFAICATLSALSFSYAKSFSTDEDVVDKIQFAGERFLHAALMIIMASVIKWAIQTILQSKVPQDIPTIMAVVKEVVRAIIGLLFLNSGMSIHSALVVLHPVLIKRYARRKEWDDIV